MPDLNNYTAPVDPPSLFEVLQATRDEGLVGEEDTVLTLVFAMLRGQLVVMTGPARAGKDEAVDAAESVFDAENLVYRWPVDDSETAAYYKRDTINQYDVHRFPDLARLEDHHEKILKAFGEGRDAERNRTNIAAEQADGGAVEDQILTCPKTVIAFIASDNEQINLDDYPELRNRALTLSVDASQEQTHRVNRRKAEEHAGMTERQVDAVRAAEIQAYHESIPVQSWTDIPGNKIVNPAAVNIHEQEPIPELFPEARQDFDRLLGFMETVTLYHYSERMVHEDSTRRMFVTPVDVWEAMTVLGNKMVMSALNLTRQDRAILELLERSSQELTKAEIQQSLRSQGFNITDRDVKRSLDSMRTKGYVRVHQDSTNTYTFNEFGSVVHHDAGLDYAEVVRASEDQIYELVPDDYADLYVDRFCSGDGLITTHPFNGEAVDIREDNTLGEMMDAGVEGIESVFEDEEPDNDNDQQALTGTLT
jgi:Fe2+ or Zn2+ uptake regulation protein